MQPLHRHIHSTRPKLTSTITMIDVIDSTRSIINRSTVEFMQRHAHLFCETTPPTTGSGSQHSQSSTPHPATPQPPATSAEASNSAATSSSGSKTTPPTPSGRRTSEASISSTMSGLSDAVVPLNTIQTCEHDASPQLSSSLIFCFGIIEPLSSIAATFNVFPVVFGDGFGERHRMTMLSARSVVHQLLRRTHCTTPALVIAFIGFFFFSMKENQ